MKSFKSLHTTFRSRPQLGSAVAEYISSTAFLAKVEEIDTNVSEKVRLTLDLLSHVALDCSQGTQVSDFLNLSPEDGEIRVCLQFNRIVNLVGDFTLLANTIDAHMLANAIQDNLDSKKFKAASHHRKQDLKTYMRCIRFRKQAQANYEVDNAKVEAKVNEGIYGTAGRDNPLYRADREQVFNNFIEFVNKRKSRLFARLSFIGKQAFDAEYQGNFREIMVNFVTEHMVPELIEVAM